MWLELYRKEKVNSGKKSLRQANTTNTSRIRRKLNSPDTDSKGKLSNGNDVKTDEELEDNQLPMSEEEKAVFAEAEAARAAAEAAAKASVFFLIFKLVKGIDGCLLNVFVFSEEGNLLSY